MNDKYRTKCVFGPGGIRCPCCRVGTQSEAKRAYRRQQRRKAKQQPLETE